MRFRELIAGLGPWSWIAALALWGLAVWIWVDRFLGLLVEHSRGWLFDWHVYAAAAKDLVQGELYRVRLVSAFPIPVDSFNYPPGSAITAVPFLAFPDDVGGFLWVLLNVASVGAVAVLTMVIVNARPIWLWSGLLFFVYSLSDWSLPQYLGNNTPLVLLFVAGGVAAHVANRSTLTGVLLGIAIAMKLWPAALLFPMARERSWQAVGWAVGTSAVITIGGLVWLGGPSALGQMIAAIMLEVEPRPTQILIGLTWLRVHTDWWPEWGGYAIAALLLLIPVKGRLGYGVATFAGMAAIPNLWRHYIGTIVFATVLVVAGLVRRREGAASADAKPKEPMPRLDDPAAAGPELGS
jgi:Glycosyltransferase family 87